MSSQAKTIWEIKCEATQGQDVSQVLMTGVLINSNDDDMLIRKQKGMGTLLHRQANCRRRKRRHEPPHSSRRGTTVSVAPGCVCGLLSSLDVDEARQGKCGGKTIEYTNTHTYQCNLWGVSVVARTARRPLWKQRPHLPYKHVKEDGTPNKSSTIILQRFFLYISHHLMNLKAGKGTSTMKGDTYDTIICNPKQVYT